MNRVLIKKSLIAVLLAIAMICLALICTGSSGLAVADGEVDFVSASDMVKNKNLLTPVGFNGDGSYYDSINLDTQISVSENQTQYTVSSWANGYFYYTAPVEGASFDIRVTSASVPASEDDHLFITLRGQANGAPWNGAGYTYLLDRFYYDGLGKWITKVFFYDCEPNEAWNAHPIQENWYAEDFFDGQLRHVELYAKNTSASSVESYMSINDSFLVGGTVSNTPLSLSGSVFKIVPNANTILYEVTATGVVSEVNQTVHNMIVNNAAGNGHITGNDQYEGSPEIEKGCVKAYYGQMFYKFDDYSANSFDFDFIATAEGCKQICMAIDTTGEGTMWSTAGYYLYILGNEAYFRQVNIPSDWANDSLNPLLGAAIVNDIFDGNAHNIIMKAVSDGIDYFEYFVSVDGVTVAEGSAREPLDKTGWFKVAQVNGVWETETLVDYKIASVGLDKHSFGETAVVAPTAHSDGYSHQDCTGCGFEHDFDIVSNTFENVNTTENAEIKVKDDLSGCGLRFEATISALNYSVYADYMTELGMIIMPADLIGEEEFTIDNYAESASVSVFDISEGAAVDPDGNIRFKVSVTDLYASNYNRVFAARPFVKLVYDDGEIVCYGDTVASTVFAAAKNSIMQYEEGSLGYETCVAFIDSVIDVSYDGAILSVDNAFVDASGCSISIAKGVVTLNMLLTEERAFSCFTYNGYRIKSSATEKSYDAQTGVLTYIFADPGYIAEKKLQTFDWDKPFDVSLYAAYDPNGYIPGNTAEHKTEGDACMTMQSIANWQGIQINLKVDGNPLTEEELDKIDYISIDIYAVLSEELATTTGGTDFYFYNQLMGWLKNGENTLSITGELFKAQMQSSASAYNTETGWGFFQIQATGVTMYIDNCVAHYK